MTLYRFTGDRVPDLRDPVLITALEGWVDTAGSATAAAGVVANGGEVIATFDADALIDYRARRPTLDIVDGDLKSITWPEITVRAVHVDGRDLLVLSGPEPDMAWNGFTAAVLDLVRRVGVVQSITLGSLAMAVPHTRPTSLLATASDRSLLRPEDHRPEGFLRVPAAAVSAIELVLREAGVPVVGFWARTPHYVSEVYAASTLALLERLQRHLGVRFPLEALATQAAEQRQQLDAVVADRPDVKEYVERLEAMDPSDEIPSADELAAEIERFLKDARDDG